VHVNQLKLLLFKFLEFFAFPFGQKQLFSADELALLPGLCRSLLAQNGLDGEGPMWGCQTLGMENGTEWFNGGIGCCPALTTQIPSF
jgi:hypothetical protein